jgi:hypothetical protein
LLVQLRHDRLQISERHSRRVSEHAANISGTAREQNRSAWEHREGRAAKLKI